MWYLLILGIISFAFGFLVLFGFIKHDVSKDDEGSKKLFSERERHFMGRYSPGIFFTAVGIMFIVLALLMFFNK